MKSATRSMGSKAAVTALAGVLLLSGAGVANAQSTASLEAQIQALMAQLNALKGTSASVTFTRDLTLGSSGSDVTALQNWLIAKGFSIPAGATGYFGAQTRTALASYQAANGIAPAAGYFGPATRAKVNASATTPTTPTTPDTSTSGSLKGGEAKLSKFDLTREESNGSEGETNVEVATAKFDVDNGDIRVERADLRVTASNNSLGNQPWKYFDSVTVYADGKEVASEDVDSKNDWDKVSDGVYRLSITGLKAIVRENDSAEITFAFDINDSIDTANLAQEFSFAIEDRGIRAVDAAGIQQYIGNASDTVSFGFDAQENGDIKIQSSNDDPDASILVADANKISGAYEVFAFDLNNSDQVDTLVTELTINVSGLTGGVTADNVIRTATLKVDGETYDGDINASTIVFEDMDLQIDGDDEVTAVLSVKLARNATSTPIAFSVSGTGIEAEGVDSGDDAQVSGTQTSDTHTIAQAGVGIKAVSTSQNVVTPGGDASSTYATYSIKYQVSAVEEDAYIASTTAESGLVGVTYGIGGTGFAGVQSATLTSTADMVNGFYQVREGDTETFTLTVTLDPSAAGTFDVRLGTIRFNTEASFNGATTFEAPSTTAYRTNPVYVAN